MSTTALKIKNLSDFKKALAAHPYWLYQNFANALVNTSVRRVVWVSSYQAIFAKPPHGGETYLFLRKASDWNFKDGRATNLDALNPGKPLLAYTPISREQFVEKLREMYPSTADIVIAAMLPNENV